MDKTAVKIITYFDGIEEFLIGLLFFTLPFGWTLSIVPLVLFTTTLLVNVFTKPQKPNKEKLLYFLPLISIFIWGIISLLYSDNVKEGIETLTTQLVLIVAALAFLFNKIPATSVKKGFYMFLLGCICSTVIMFGIAIYNSSSFVGDAFIFRPFFTPQGHCMLDTDTSGSYFLGRAFSCFIHPAYNALMLSMAMFIILHNLKTSSKLFIHHNFWLSCFTLFGISIILFSLNGTLALSIIIILIILGILSIRKIYYGENVRTIYCILFVFAALIIVNPQTQHIADAKSAESLINRVKITNASFDVIKDNWLIGVGIGDTKEELFNAYINRDEQQLAKRKLNSHNQFLTTWIGGGIIGLALLIWSFVSLSLRAQRKKVMLLHLFSIVVIVSFFFESMLLRYWGVITFTFFYSILYFYSQNEVEEKIVEE